MCSMKPSPLRAADDGDLHTLSFNGVFLYSVIKVLYTSFSVDNILP